MRLICLSMVKNEHDIIECFARHTLHFVDSLLIIDNGSTDGTREILESLTQEGQPIVIFDDPDTAYLQSERMTKLYRESIGSYDPDYVLLLDADEFLRVGSRAQLEHSLRSLPSGSCGTIPWQTYVLGGNTPGIATDQGTDVEGHARMQTRRAEERPEYSKVVVPARWLAGRTIQIMLGNHEIRSNDRTAIQHVPIPGVTIAHLPVRSLDQIQTKVLFGWLAYLAKDPLSAQSDKGTQWRDLFNLLMERRLTSEDLARISFNYAQNTDLLDPVDESNLIEDPFPLRVEIRYKAAPVSPPLVELARSAAQVVDSVTKSTRRWWRFLDRGGKG